MSAAIDITTSVWPGEPAFIARVRLRAHRRALWLRKMWSAASEPVTQGLAVSDQEVDRTLANPIGIAESERIFYQADPSARELGAEIDGGDRAAADDHKLLLLRAEFGLSDAEIDMLSLVAAAEAEPAMARVCGYLHDDVSACYPTQSLALRLFQRTAAARLYADCGLVEWRLAYPVEGRENRWGLTTPWTADPSVVTWLLGGEAELLAQGAGVVKPPVTNRDCLYPDELARMREFVATFLRPDSASRPAWNSPIEIDLIGPVGSGRKILAGQLASVLGMRILAADASALAGADPSPTVAAERAIRIARAGRIGGFAIYFDNADAVDPKVWRSVSHDGLAFFAASQPLAPRGSRAIRRTFTLAPLSRKSRAALWRGLSNHSVPARVMDWSLTPEQIAAASRVADGGDQAVAEACRRVLAHGPADLLTPLQCPYEWSDLIVDENVGKLLKDLKAQVGLRAEVYEEWGYARLSPLGRGVSALFSGPSGTGKTMAAQVLARSLGMDLYRIDLAGVMNKYIGETEKNLRRLFETCERANVVLFFDEADALFGHRTQVKDAHDRFANIEIDYLLQRMESFDGVAILATNRKDDVDPAFIRRLRFIVDFVAPGPPERMALWRLALTPQNSIAQPALADDDWALLAERLPLTGAEIKASALGAAFLACAEGARIGLAHVLYAARRELIKRGVTVRADELKDLHHA